MTTSSSMSASGSRSSRRWRRVAGRAGGLALGLVAVLGLGLLAVSETGPGHRLVAGLAEDAAGVRLRGLEGSLLSDFTVAEFAVADPEGAWLTVRGLRIAWRPLALLDGTLHVAAVEA